MLSRDDLFISATPADLNGDGLLDFVGMTVSQTEQVPRVVVFRNKGDGTFAGGGGWFGYVSVVADVNGGAPDILMVPEGADAVRVLLNNGDGTFSGVDYATGDGPVSMVAARLNADGYNDIAVLNSVSGTVSVLVNHGDGTFAPKSDFATGKPSETLAAADLTGDGMSDLREPQAALPSGTGVRWPPWQTGRSRGHSRGRPAGWPRSRARLRRGK